ncbi:MAG: T9SS type A sorting domain-containing protein [Marinirhabdus sp.]
MPIIQLPKPDLHQIHKEDSINDRDKSKPWRYGITREIAINLEKGQWVDLPEAGGRLWRIGVHSPNAMNISINFDAFQLPNGGKLQLFSPDGSDFSKAYTGADNTPTKRLGSWFINSDTVYIEYFQPETVTQMPVIKINSLIHGYRMGAVARYLNGPNKGLNDSGSCNYDVNCSVGEDYEGRKNLIKKTVALLNLGNGYLCSAALLNTTKNDKTPYLLTANHCLENSDPSLWSVRFNWVSPNPVCGSASNSADIASNFTMSGTAVRANSALTDFALVELVNAIPENWDIAFAGWDRTDAHPSYEVSLHHPKGDIMKIARDNTGAVKEIANGTPVWLIGGVSAGVGNGWEIGTTESGSSGAPLFDQNGRVIGQLHGGKSSCDGTQNNGDYDVFGRFGVSWDGGGQPENSLSDWLDPLNSGLAVTETLQNILNVNDNQTLGRLQIYPNPASTAITVMNNRYPKLSYRMFTLLGQEVSQGLLYNTLNTIDVKLLSEGIYFLHLSDGDTGSTMTERIVVSH